MAQSNNVKLSATLTNGGDVDDFLMSPDGSTIVYAADQDTDGVVELYSVPVAGGTVTKLNGTLVSGGNVSNSTSFGPSISPDSSRVVYPADQDTNDQNELYSVPIGGVTAIKLTTIPAFVNADFLISPDSSTVVYRAVQQSGDGFELFSVPVGGGPVTELSGDNASGSGGVAFDNFRLTPDGDTVLYLADQQTTGVIELYSVPTCGGRVTKLSGEMAGSEGVLRGGAHLVEGTRLRRRQIAAQPSILQSRTQRTCLSYIV